MKKICRMLATAFLFVLVIASVKTTVNAADGPWALNLTGASRTVYNIKRLQADNYNWDNSVLDTFVDESVSDEALIPKVQCISSNPGVATVEINESGNNSFVFFHVDKPGTTTIFTTVEYNGETYDYVTKLVVVAWKNPVKTLKIGKKSFAKKFASNDTYYTGDVKKGKFKIKAAKGWKIKYIKFINGNKSKKIKNGSTINMKKAYMNAEIKVKLYNSKLKRTEYIYLKKAQVFG